MRWTDHVVHAGNFRYAYKILVRKPGLNSFILFPFVWNYKWLLHKVKLYFYKVWPVPCRSQWPRGLRHELSSPAQILGSWVRIPLGAWISVCVYPMIVLSCVQVAALRQADPRPRSPTNCSKQSRNWKSGRGPTKGCRAIDREIPSSITYFGQ
jgi:hypothetical protein